MSVPLLDLYLLSLLDRGLDTPYSLQRKGGLSLGASTPSLRRLIQARLVKRQEETGLTNRPKHVYAVTAAGRELARSGWRDQFLSSQVPHELDGVLRLADMAMHYGARTDEIVQFLTAASEQRKSLARRAAAAVVARTSIIAYQESRSRCEAARLKAEAGVLAELASEILESRSHLLSASGKHPSSQSAVPKRATRKRP